MADRPDVGRLAGLVSGAVPAVDGLHLDPASDLRGATLPPVSSARLTCSWRPEGFRRCRPGLGSRCSWPSSSSTSRPSTGGSSTSIGRTSGRRPSLAGSHDPIAPIVVVDAGRNNLYKCLETYRDPSLPGPVVSAPPMARACGEARCQPRTGRLVRDRAAEGDAPTAPPPGPCPALRRRADLRAALSDPDLQSPDPHGHDGAAHPPMTPPSGHRGGLIPAFILGGTGSLEKTALKVSRMSRGMFRAT